jgi:Trypsin
MKLTKLAWSMAVGLTLATPMSATALVGGAGVTANSANSPWNGVGSLNVGGGLFTATMIAPGYLLTAAHVVAGAAASNVSFQVNAATSYSIAASEIFINPDYTGSTTGNVAGDPTVHNDLAIIRLTGAPGADIPFYNLYSGNIQGADLNFVSFGGSSTAKTTGENIADMLSSNAAGTNQTYLFDFDGPTQVTNVMGGGSLGANREASLVNGDSGSAAFVKVGGQWQLAGVNTFEATFAGGPTTAGAFGTGGGGVVVKGYVSWINGVIATPVPEPETGGLFVIGLVSMLGLIKRREKGLS